MPPGIKDGTSAAAGGSNRADPEQARSQPSPADADKALLQKQGKPTAPEPVAKVEDRVIPGPGAGIKARIYWPKVKGLPPATVVLAQIDPLRSEGQMYADNLRAAGVDVAVQKYDAVTHEFFGMGAVHPKAKQAVASAAARLRGSLGAMKKK